MKEEIKKFAKEEGFDLFGITEPKNDPKYKKAFDTWLKKKLQATMAYMESTNRKNPKNTLPKAKSVICLGMNYYHEQEPLKKGYGRVARYAYGRDYHKIITTKLKSLTCKLDELAKEKSIAAAFRYYVDTGPLLERALAEQSGLGFIGKNSTLINPKFGSWIFLAEIVTTLNLEPDEPQLRTTKPFAGCGGCTKCMEACPTGAIIAPGVIDANRCISYLTIENKGSIPQSLKASIKKSGYIFGCDICQEVCPHNKKAKITHHESLKDPRLAGDQISLKKVAGISSRDQFLRTYAGSPLTRTKLSGLKRNAKILSDT